MASKSDKRGGRASDGNGCNGMDTKSQLHHFLEEDELDIEAIMRPAAQPSVFNEEVYM